MNTYQLNAEAPIDIGRMLTVVNVQTMAYVWVDIGHVAITFTSPWGEEEVIAGLKKIVDGHTMVRSLLKLSEPPVSIMVHICQEHGVSLGSIQKKRGD